jgi:hypothetical protein
MTGETSARAETSSRLGDLLVVAVLTMVAAGFPVVAHLLWQPAGIAACAFVAILIGNFLPAAVPAVLVGAYVLQNFCVALVTPWIHELDTFNAIRGYNFVLTATTWLVVTVSFWTTPTSKHPALRGLVIRSMVPLALIGLYFAIGMMSDARSAVIYLRNIGTPLLLFQVCLISASRAGPGTIALMAPVGVFALLYGYAELVGRSTLYTLVNAWSYIDLNMTQERNAGTWLRELQETGRVIRGVEDRFKVDILNTSLLSDLNIQVYRLLGPNFHSISFGYALCFFCLPFMAAGRWFMVLASLPVLLVIGSKGALMVLLATACGLIVSRVIRPSLLLTVFVLALVAYAAVAIVVGLRVGDYHAVGLVGGLQGFLQNPAGHGLGAGGNLSMNMTAIDWNRSQALGKTDGAVESAVGVILFQMGVAGLAVWLAYGAIALRAWRGFRETGGAIFAVITFSVLTVAMNGLLQEEALFSPLAMGALMALAGLALGELSWAAETGSLPSHAQARSPAALRDAVQHGAGPA